MCYHKRYYKRDCWLCAALRCPTTRHVLCAELRCLHILCWLHYYLCGAAIAIAIAISVLLVLPCVALCCHVPLRALCCAVLRRAARPWAMMCCATTCAMLCWAAAHYAITCVKTLHKFFVLLPALRSALLPVLLLGYYTCYYLRY